jgi:hypothetical protein
MNEEITPQSQAAPEVVPSASGVSSTPASTSGGGLPSWLPYLFLAVVPAVVVGVLVYVFAGGDSGGGDGVSAAILESFLVPAEDSNTRVDSYKGVMPEDFPTDFPVFGNAETVASFVVATPEGTTYRAVLTTAAPASEVFDYYRDVLDNDPWQVEIGQIGAQVTGIQFTRPDNPDVSGVVIVSESELEESTVIQLVYQNVTETLAPGTGPAVPQLGQNRPLPPGFPEEISIYGVDGETIVIDSYFQRGQGGQLFAVTLLTQDSQDDVIAYYRNEFEALGWTVNDSETTDATSFAVGIDFDDGKEILTGQVLADTYEEDANYTRVDLLVQVSGASTN